MTRKIAKLVMFLFLFNICMIPMEARAADNSIIDIKTAREMAVKNSRSMKSKILSVDKKMVEEEQKENAYYGSDLKGLLKHKQQRLEVMEQELKDLINGGADPALIAAKEGEIAGYNASIAALKAQMNAGMVEYNKDNYDDAKYATEDAERAKADFEEQLGYQVEQKYSGILQQEAQLLQVEKSHQLKVRSLEIERIKKDLGMSTSVDVQKLAVDVTTLDNSIKQSANSLKVARWQFNDLLGRDYDLSLELTQYSIPIITHIPGYEELLEKLMNNNAAYNQMKRGITTGKDRLDAEYLDDSNKEKLAEYGLQGQELALVDEEMKLKAKAINLITDLKTKMELYDNSRVSAATAKNQYDWDLQKYELGLISQIQKDTAELTYIEVTNKMYKAGHELYLANRAVQMAEKGILTDGGSTMADASAAAAGM